MKLLHLQFSQRSKRAALLSMLLLCTTCSIISSESSTGNMYYLTDYLFMINSIADKHVCLRRAQKKGGKSAAEAEGATVPSETLTARQ